MFLHLGNDLSVRTREILAVLDYSAFRKGKNAQFLRDKEEKGLLFRSSDLLEEEIKSLVITKKMIYLSPISTHTLYKRQRKQWDDLAQIECRRYGGEL